MADRKAAKREKRGGDAGMILWNGRKTRVKATMPHNGFGHGIPLVRLRASLHLHPLAHEDNWHRASQTCFINVFWPQSTSFAHLSTKMISLFGINYARPNGTKVAPQIFFGQCDYVDASELSDSSGGSHNIQRVSTNNASVRWPAPFYNRQLGAFKTCCFVCASLHCSAAQKPYTTPSETIGSVNQ